MEARSHADQNFEAAWLIYLVSAAIVTSLGSLWLSLGWGTLIVVLAVALLWSLELRMVLR